MAPKGNGFDGVRGLINEMPDCAAEVDLSSSAMKNMHLLHYARSTILLFYAALFTEISMSNFGQVALCLVSDTIK